MNKLELVELIEHCPVLYHMAERSSWDSIRSNGLLSTTALLDLYKYSGHARAAIEARRRSTSVILSRDDLAHATVRDQLPMDDNGLSRCLQDGITPEGWYRNLNSKVFFWLTRERLLRLLNAGTYRQHEHDVLEIDSKSIIEVYYDNIWLCPMNSGCTKPFAHPRGHSTFLRVKDYPYQHWKSKRPRGERVVELAVDYAIRDVRKYVTRVVRMKSAVEIEVLFKK